MKPRRMCWHNLERMGPAAQTIQVGGGEGGICTEARGGAGRGDYTLRLGGGGRGGGGICTEGEGAGGLLTEKGVEGGVCRD